MVTTRRLNYYRRVASAYLGRRNSHLTFWHGQPEVNPHAQVGSLDQYYMRFRAKADYGGEYDAAGIPMVNYHGHIGLQYNPIAIAQYGLGNYNLARQQGDPQRRQRALAAADWLVRQLQPNAAGYAVWMHHFDWEYRTPLKAPWYSGLAQGQGISLLLRAYRATGCRAYYEAAQQAFAALLVPVDQGGVIFVDDQDHVWIEEYIVDPPTHILNGAIWASWGVFDYWLATREPLALSLFNQLMVTLEHNLHRYDIGFWSLYEQSGTRLSMLASPFYHQLHIVQLRILATLTGEDIFRDYAQRWEGYARSRINRSVAFGYKFVFKLLYY